MKKNKVFTGNFIEILENSELRNVVGGYDDPYGREECCLCSVTRRFHGTPEPRPWVSIGIICSSYGEPNCESGKDILRKEMEELFGNELNMVDIFCG